MMSVLWPLLVCLCACGAYRAIRGVFAGPQSERLSNYGFVGYAVLLIFTASMAVRLFLKKRRTPSPVSTAP
jgi:hypothetical protein